MLVKSSCTLELRDIYGHVSQVHHEGKQMNIEKTAQDTSFRALHCAGRYGRFWQRLECRSDLEVDGAVYNRTNAC